MATPQPFDPSALERIAAAFGWQAPAFDPLPWIGHGSADTHQQIPPLVAGMPSINRPAVRATTPQIPLVSWDSTPSDDGIQARTDQLNRVATSCRQRIRELDDFARSEGFRVNAASEHTFWRFFERYPFGAQPGLVLLDNGNLRATWGDMKPTHIGLQFLPNDQIQYVIFAAQSSSPGVMRGRGRVGTANIPKLLESYGLAEVLDP